MNTNLLRARVRYGIARQADFEALGVDEVRAIKGDKEATQYRFVERAVKVLGERQFEHDGSTEHQDAMGDIIKVAGWDTMRMRVGGRIPLFLNHSPHPAPMGLVLAAKKDWTNDTPKVRSLVIRSEVYSQDIYGDAECGKVIEAHYRLMELGHLRGGSVGFIPRAWRYPTDEEERTTLGLGKFGMLFEEQELLEFSITTIPANPHANTRKSLDDVKALVTAGTLAADLADVWMKALAVHPDEWLERNVPNITRKSFALPAWVKGAANEGVHEDAAAAPGPCCTDASKAMAAIVREVLRDEVPALVRAELAVLRSKNSASDAASVNASQDDSTIDRGTDAAEAQVVDAAGTPGTSSRTADPLAFYRALLG